MRTGDELLVSGPVRTASGQLPPQKGKRLCEGVSEDGRQHPPEVPGYNAGAVGGGNGPKVLGRDALQEVPHPLGRRLIPRAAKGVGFLLP